MALRPATEQNGVAGLHLQAIAEVCRKWNCFLFIRPSESATVRLIKAGFATKSMDIHEKSSDWGLHAGLVPQDAALSKRPGVPNDAIVAQHHGLAQSIPLKFSPAQFNSLRAAGHFEHIQAFNGPCTGAQPGYLHFHADTKCSSACFLLKQDDYTVHWCSRGGARRRIVPLYVKAYHGVPVTGDYDMWMVAPHYQDIRTESRERVLTSPDAHGRSASLDYTRRLSRALNVACTPRYPGGKNVFNHGAEAQNFSFTQEMEKKDLVVCGPGRHAPFLIHPLREPERLTGLLHDILRHGYVVMLNPKWKHGFTLGAEDMAFVPDALLDSAEPGEKAALARGVGASRATVGDLEDGAASMIQRAFRARKMAREGKSAVEIAAHQWVSSTSPTYALFKGRAARLLEFRSVARIPENQGRDLVVPREVFPYWNQTALATDGRAREIGGRQEAQFGRTGFVLEGEEGHRGLVPVDRSR